MRTMRQQDGIRSPASIRPAGLVDVPAVVRLLVPADRPPPAPGGTARAQRAVRLLLAHYTLEEGRVWVAEYEHGGLTAAAIWLPPGAQPPGARLGGPLHRELHHPVDLIAAGERARAAFEAVRPGERHWTVVTVGALGPTADPGLAADLLAPGLDAVDRQSATAVAITATHVDAAQLRPFGFRDPREVPLGPAARAWLSHRPSGGDASYGD